MARRRRGRGRGLQRHFGLRRHVLNRFSRRPKGRTEPPDAYDRDSSQHNWPKPPPDRAATGARRTPLNIRFFAHNLDNSTRYMCTTEAQRQPAGFPASALKNALCMGKSALRQSRDDGTSSRRQSDHRRVCGVQHADRTSPHFHPRPPGSFCYKKVVAPDQSQRRF